MSCQFEQRTRLACSESEVIGFEFCPEHLATPRGLQHAQDRIRTGPMFTVADVESEISKRTDIPEVDYHTSALEKMDATLTEVMEWTKQCRQRLDAVPVDDWRFTDRTQSEQVRTEFTAYERALEREARILKDVSKMAIQEKIVSLGRAQTELIIRIMMRTLEKLSLSESQFAEARATLLKEFQEEGNLSTRVEDNVTKQLEPVPVDAGNVVDAEVVN